MSQYICIIAHDKMKPVLVSFIKEHKDWFWGRKFIATGLTAEFVEQGVELPVEHVSAGRQGGYRELTDMVNNGNISAVLFFRDPEIVQDYEADVIQFIKTCIRQNVPLASNPASAKLLLVGLIRMEASRKNV